MKVYLLTDGRYSTPTVFSTEDDANKAAAILQEEGHSEVDVRDVDVKEEVPRRVQKWTARRESHSIHIAEYLVWEGDVGDGWYDSEQEAVAALYEERK